jgi:hypothetical protein
MRRKGLLTGFALLCFGGLRTRGYWTPSIGRNLVCTGEPNRPVSVDLILVENFGAPEVALGIRIRTSAGHEALGIGGLDVGARNPPDRVRPAGADGARRRRRGGQSNPDGNPSMATQISSTFQSVAAEWSSPGGIELMRWLPNSGATGCPLCRRR